MTTPFKTALYLAAIVITLALLGQIHGGILAVGLIALLGWGVVTIATDLVEWFRAPAARVAEDAVIGAEAAAPAAVIEVPLDLGTPEAVAIDAALEETEAAAAPVPDRWAAYDSPAVYRRRSKWRAAQVVWPAVPLDGIQLADVVRQEAPVEEIATPFDGLEPAVLPVPAMLAEMVS